MSVFDALAIGATGMQAQQTNVETIANNIVNSNTPTFKKSRVEFKDLMTTESKSSDAASAPQRTGVGVGIASVTKVFDAGDLTKTGSPLDVAVRGDGFLEVTQPDGTSAYIRGGSLKVNKDGLLAGPTGLPLKPAIAIPDNALSITIAQNGQVLITVPNQAGPIEAGRIDIVRFTNPAMLDPQGDNVYRATNGSGEPTLAQPGQDGAGTLAQGFVEASNISMVDEMMKLTVAQRAYQACAEVIKAADQMAGMVNSLTQK